MPAGASALCLVEEHVLAQVCADSKWGFKQRIFAFGIDQSRRGWCRCASPRRGPDLHPTRNFFAACCRREKLLTDLDLASAAGEASDAPYRANHAFCVSRISCGLMTY